MSLLRAILRDPSKRTVAFEWQYNQICHVSDQALHEYYHL